MHRRLAPFVPVAALLFAASACREDEGPRRITQTREAVVQPGSVVVDATSARRFGGGEFRKPQVESDAPRRELVWDVPSGWKELPPTEMRLANLQPAGHADAECYVSKLPSDGGGVAKNVNRWRGQFGLAEISEKDVAALPRQKLLKILDATRVELEGSFKGMGSDGAARSGFALIGLIAQVRVSPDESATIFLKMTGPEALVASERARFDEFANSLRIDTPASRKDAATAPTSPPSPKSQSNAGGFTWTLPAGWTTTGHPSTMRLATLVPAGAKQSECALFAMPGDAGGIARNVNRWRQQMGLAELDDAAVAALPKTPMLGHEATLLDVTGDFSDTMNQRSITDARFLGAIVLLDAQTFFLKLTGPRSELGDDVRAQFLALCASTKATSEK